MKKFIPNKIALITLLAACGVILVSMGLRQTFGLFFSAFEQDLNCTRTEFGLEYKCCFGVFLLLYLEY